MTFGDGTTFGFSEPQGAGITVTLTAIFGEPISKFSPEAALTLGTFSSGCFGCGIFGGLYVTDLPPIS